MRPKRKIGFEKYEGLATWRAVSQQRTSRERQADEEERTGQRSGRQSSRNRLFWIERALTPRPYHQLTVPGSARTSSFSSSLSP